MRKTRSLGSITQCHQTKTGGPLAIVVATGTSCDRVMCHWHFQEVVGSNPATASSVFQAPIIEYQR